MPYCITLTWLLVNLFQIVFETWTSITCGQLCRVKRVYQRSDASRQFYTLHALAVSQARLGFSATSGDIPSNQIYTDASKVSFSRIQVSINLIVLLNISVLLTPSIDLLYCLLKDLWSNSQFQMLINSQHRLGHCFLINFSEYVSL